MTPISAGKLAALLETCIDAKLSDTLVTGVATDHRRVQPGDAFVAFVGQSSDGHDYVNEAFHRGASVAIVSKPVKSSRPAILSVPDPLSAIQTLAMAERKSFTGPVIGITGSNGKTTTKQMVAAVVSLYGPCLYTQANQNNELGLPLTILQLKPVHRAIVLEMGMRGLGQISDLCRIAKPTIGIITNIGQSHLELLGSQAAIAQAKGELLESLPAEGQAILHDDDPWLKVVSSKSAAPIMWYGMTQSATVRARDVTYTNSGMTFTVEYQSECQPMSISTFGPHNVANALAAVSTGLILGATLDEIAGRLTKIEDVAGRLTLLQGRNGQTIIDDCYNASPLSMKASLDVLVHLTPDKPSAAILGDMFELGAMTEAAHREVGEYVASMGIDTLVTIGRSALELANAAKSRGLAQVYAYTSVEEAIPHLDSLLNESSTVLVKASRGMHLEEVVDALRWRDSTK